MTKLLIFLLCAPLTLSAASAQGTSPMDQLDQQIAATNERIFALEGKTQQLTQEIHDTRKLAVTKESADNAFKEVSLRIDGVGSRIESLTEAYHGDKETAAALMASLGQRIEDLSAQIVQHEERLYGFVSNDGQGKEFQIEGLTAGAHHIQGLRVRCVELQTNIDALRAQVDDHQKNLTGASDGFFTLAVAHVLEELPNHKGLMERFLNSVRQDPVVIGRVAEAVRKDEIAKDTIALQAGLRVGQQLRKSGSFRLQVAKDAVPKLAQDEATMDMIVASLGTYLVGSGTLLEALVGSPQLVSTLASHMEQDTFMSALAARVAAKVTQSDVLARTIEAVERTEQAQPLSPLRRSSSSARTQGAVAERLRNDKCFLDAVCMALKGDQSFVNQMKEILRQNPPIFDFEVLGDEFFVDDAAKRIAARLGLPEDVQATHSLLEAVSKHLEPVVQQKIKQTVQENLLVDEAFLAALAARIPSIKTPPAPLSPAPTAATPPPSVQDFFQDLLVYLQTEGAGRVRQVMEEVALSDQVPPQTPTTQSMLENAGQRARDSRGLTRDSLQGWKPGETRVSQSGRPLTLI